MIGLSVSDKARARAPKTKPLAWWAVGVFGGVLAGAAPAVGASGNTGTADLPDSAEAHGAALTAIRPPATPASSNARGLVFDSAYLFTGAGGPPLDLSRFEQEGKTPPGTYRLEISVNGRWQGMEDIDFAETTSGTGARPCFRREQLERLGIDMDKAARGQSGSDELNPMPDALFCGDLAQYVPGASVNTDMAEQKLSLQVPAIFVHFASASTYVGPEKWENGVTAGLLNYNVNLYSSENQGKRSNSGYLGLNGGLNLGAWRLRHNGALSWGTGRAARYQSGSVYLQTDVPAWRSQLVLGETASSGELFDSLSFRGVQLSSDERMMPDTQRNYAPVIHGTARTNAKVSVSQRGYLIYETTVAPGAFTISDLQASGEGGDLLVKVTEADGQEYTSVVPYAATPQLLRGGVQRYSLIAGQVKQPGLTDDPLFAQAIYQRGLNGMWTAYAGATASQGYASGLFGVAANTSVGAFAADLTRAESRLSGDRRIQGNSLRLSYSKKLNSTGTNFSLLAYRYSTSGYLSLIERIVAEDQYQRRRTLNAIVRQRHRFDVNISQQLGGGSLYANGSMQQFWGSDSKEVNFSVGYGGNVGSVSYTLSAQRARNLTQGQTTQERSRTTYALNVSVPLGDSRRLPTLSGFLSHDSESGLQTTTSLAGTLGDDNRGSYSVSASHSERGGGGGSAGLGYQLPYTQLNASVSAGRGYNQYSASAAGALVAHPGGVTLAQTLGETLAVVRVPDAEGALVGATRARVDARGYAVVPSLTPYHLNTIEVNPKGMPLDVELKQSTSKGLAPRAGSVVMLSYATEVARATLIDSRMPGDKPLPFGAAARNARGDNVGVVGQGGRLFAKGLEPNGWLIVEWGGAPEQQCRIDYQLPEKRAGRQQRYDMLVAPCLPQAQAAASTSQPSP
ncbi:fimbria/pilus outer membrane usher protein [Chromobacterium haemolyticum]|uniref:fimbria/pilus outer membrane usher protein n=1 Tax=Chromobacterium haemolyticum TaxID=394935 RepID=UPI0003158218|nr:fimbria/pilus outer membrane usher protein [Chromobacterium haemolyticum]